MGWYVIGALVLIFVLGRVSYIDGVQDPKENKEWTAYTTVAWLSIAIVGGLFAWKASIAPGWMSFLLWFVGLTVDWKAGDAGQMVRLKRSHEATSQICSAEQ